MKPSHEVAREAVHPILAIGRRCYFGRKPADVHGVLCNAITDSVVAAIEADRAESYIPAAAPKGQP